MAAIPVSLAMGGSLGVMGTPYPTVGILQQLSRVTPVPDIRAAIVHLTGLSCDWTPAEAARLAATIDGSHERGAGLTQTTCGRQSG